MVHWEFGVLVLAAIIHVRVTDLWQVLTEHLLEHVGDALISQLDVVAALKWHHRAIYTILDTAVLG